MPFAVTFAVETGNSRPLLDNLSSGPSLVLRLPTREEGQSNATAASSMISQPTPATLSPDALSASYHTGRKNAQERKSRRESPHVCRVGTAPESAKIIACHVLPLPPFNSQAVNQSTPLGDDIKTIMSILRVVKSAGFAELASDFRRARTKEDRLAVILAHQDLLAKLESL
ncbi:hypothetical protein EVAR_59921_1 [Eumeta japonica]|uniref:Uncharacterized protein n=1 Tax=Eumeta variegata TaxID=151549 RepID=A0A4C1YUQ6_EUMVA|nr:hypothetical protein EVAR_59921_1 [Eumeta japonica]